MIGIAGPLALRMNLRDPFSVYLFCLAMDPFTYLNRIPGVISVQGYIDDTTIGWQLPKPQLAGRSGLHVWVPKISWVRSGRTLLLSCMYHNSEPQTCFVLRKKTVVPVVTRTRCRNCPASPCNTAWLCSSKNNYSATPPRSVLKILLHYKVFLCQARSTNTTDFYTPCACHKTTLMIDPRNTRIYNGGGNTTHHVAGGNIILQTSPNGARATRNGVAKPNTIGLQQWVAGCKQCMPDLTMSNTIGQWNSKVDLFGS